MSSKSETLLDSTASPTRTPGTGICCHTVAAVEGIHIPGVRITGATLVVAVSRT